MAGMARDKQLRSVTLGEVVEKRRLAQALNAKEFAVLAGISYSTARDWFHLPGFPVLHGRVFWDDFVQWRTAQTGLSRIAQNVPQKNSANDACPTETDLPPRASRILHEAG